jgi:hypothetical protein
VVSSPFSTLFLPSSLSLSICATTIQLPRDGASIACLQFATRAFFPSPQKSLPVNEVNLNRLFGAGIFHCWESLEEKENRFQIPIPSMQPSIIAITLLLFLLLLS